jgi:hypothetical protein
MANRDEYLLEAFITSYLNEDIRNIVKIQYFRKIVANYELGEFHYAAKIAIERGLFDSQGLTIKAYILYA